MLKVKNLWREESYYLAFPLQNTLKTGIQILNTKNYQSIDGQVLQQL